MGIWFVDSSPSSLPDAINGLGTSLNTVIKRDVKGAFFATQRSFVRATEPDFLTLPTPGVDIPFMSTLETPRNAFTKRTRYNYILEGNNSTGSPLTLLTAPIDDTPRFIATSGSPQENALKNFQSRKRWRFSLAGEKNSFSMFPAFVPATQFSTFSCDVLSEIQRHMLEPTIDGGLTWSPLWTKSEVQGYFNERLSRFYLSTGVIQNQFSVPVLAGSSEYNYPTDLVQTKRLSFEQNLDLYSSVTASWRLEEPTNAIRIDSIGPNNLTSAGGTTQVNGKIGNAAGFDATIPQYLTIPNASKVNLNPGTSDCAFSIWFFPVNTTGNTNYTILANYNNITGNGYWIFQRGTGVAFLSDLISVTMGTVTGPAGCQFHTTNKVVMNSWNHLFVYMKRSSFLYVYLNNVRQAPSFGSSENMSAFGNTTGNCNPDLEFTLGTLNTFGGAHQQSFNGNIDATQVFIMPTSLTTAQINSMQAELWNEGNGRELFRGAHDGPYTVLPRQDPFSQDNGDPGWQDETGTPSVIIEEPRTPLSFQLAPTPSTNGSVEGIYVADPTPIGDACVPLPIPNFLTWGIKYGVMADMLNKEGEAQDPQRATYCEQRWSECIQLTRMLLGFNDDDSSDPSQDNTKGKPQ